MERKISLDTPVQYLKGVGEARAELFGAYGIETARDLLYWIPYRYEDRRHPRAIASIRAAGEPVLLRGRVVSSGAKTSPVKRIRIVEAILDDGTGTIGLVWFNQPYLADRIRKGETLSVYGTPRISAQGRLQLENPDWEKLDEGSAADDGAIVPIYSQVQRVPPKVVRRAAQQAVEAAGEIAEPLPPELAGRLGVIPLAEALVEVHAPAEMTAELAAFRAPAHRRLILQEFFAFQLALRLRRASEETRRKNRTIEITDETRQKVREILPFRLTAAQKRVLREISDDLQRERPMYRLLQGDVGSGKTIVALIAALLAIGNGHQVALLAPTAILAEQHEQRIRQLVDDKIRVAKLTGATRAKERRPLLAALRAGEIDLLVGTHALIEKPVEFRSLALAIVDEQHRFGVMQRQKLFEKGSDPDILVMTATPIPRSLAIAMYG
ncbi:MAG: ATP-dependent DNA helicase RecG, partial [Thermoanaerobaculia bacterium]